MRVAAIDIGTVTCRMLIADCTVDADIGEIRMDEIAKEYAITNLGDGVDSTHRLKDSAIERVIDTLERYLLIRDGFSDGDRPMRTVTVATSASRDAENSETFISALEKLGLDLHIIAGSEEAELSFMGATSQFDDDLCIVIDIGGGSTEISIGPSSGKPVHSKSFDIGCRRITERFYKTDPPEDHEIDLSRKFIAGELGAWFNSLRKKGISKDRDADGGICGGAVLIAVAGTATSVVSMRDKMEIYDSDRVNKSVVDIETLEDITDSLSRMSCAERKSIVGLDPGRAPVIVAGLVILEEVMKATGASSFVVSETDILEGIVMDTVTGALSKDRA